MVSFHALRRPFVLNGFAHVWHHQAVRTFYVDDGALCDVETSRSMRRESSRRGRSDLAVRDSTSPLVDNPDLFVENSRIEGIRDGLWLDIARSPMTDGQSERTTWKPGQPADAV
jgi:hypothetical protein